MAQEAKAGAADVAGEAKEQVSQVAHAASDQLQDTWHGVRQDLRTQASQQTDRAGAGLRRLSDQLDALRSGDIDRAGPVADYARQLQTQVQQMAERVERHGFDGMVSDLRSFARRRPGAFLAGAAAVGFVAGRMLRSSAGGGTGMSASGSGRAEDRVPALGVPATRVPPSVLGGTSDSPPPVPPAGVGGFDEPIPPTGVGVDTPGVPPAGFGPQRGL